MTRAADIARTVLAATDGDHAAALSVLATLYAELEARHAATTSPGFERAAARAVWRAGRVAATDMPEAL